MNIILERVSKVCNTVRENCPAPAKFKKLISLTKKTFAIHGFDIKIRTKKEKFLDVDKFYIMAYYDSYEDQQGETPIEVIVHHNLIGTEEFGPHQVTGFLTEIFDAVVHEHRHQHQSIERDFEEYSAHCYTPYDEYLSNTDEIDAYAVNIAVEMIRLMGKERAKRYMQRISVMSKIRQGPAFAIPMLRAYVSQFPFDPVIKKLSKKIYKHLEELDTKHVFK